MKIQWMMLVNSCKNLGFFFTLKNYFIKRKEKWNCQKRIQFKSFFTFALKQDETCQIFCHISQKIIRNEESILLNKFCLQKAKLV
jgi:hypothetical protein